MENKTELLIELHFHLQSSFLIMKDLEEEGIKDLKLKSALSSAKNVISNKVAKINHLSIEASKFYANMEIVFRTFKELNLDDKIAINIKRDLMYQALEKKEIWLNKLEGFLDGLSVEESEVVMDKFLEDIKSKKYEPK